MQQALAKFIKSNVAKANEKTSSNPSLKATAIDEVTLQQCPIELQNDAVSDTTNDDSSNSDHNTIINLI
ncbi:MAG TPA: hypothetical protein VL095_16550 [Flavisolibacter sp.]|nr:hypothetical protein [Flavisolibacter sp.]